MQAAVKYRAMSFCLTAPKRQPKASHGEIPGNEFLPDRAEATTECKAR